MPRDGLQQELLPAPAVKRRRAAKPFRLVASRQAEHDLQIQCADAFAAGVLLPDVTWTSIDSAFSRNQKIGRNGREIGWGELAKRKRRGIKPGVPDMAFWRDGRGYLIELKVGDGEPTEDQEIFLRSLIISKIEVAVCWTFFQVMQRLQLWGLLRPGVRWA